MTWLPDSAEGRTRFERVLGLRPELLADLQVFVDALWRRGGVDPALLELCRLRVAQILGWEAERQQRPVHLSEEKIAALETWRGSARFSALESACLALAEKFVLDPRGVSDADIAVLSDHLAP